MTELAWHFLCDRDGKPTLRDGRTAPGIGEWLAHDGPVSMCETGLHASTRLIDTLAHTPSTRLCLVEVDGVEDRDVGSLVCRRRRIVAMFDAGDLLSDFARLAAESVVHLWGAPQAVRDYLKTGDETARAYVEGAAWLVSTYAARHDAAWAACAVWNVAKGDFWGATWAALQAAGHDSAARDDLNAALESFVLTELARLGLIDELET